MKVCKENAELLVTLYLVCLHFLQADPAAFLEARIDPAEGGKKSRTENQSRDVGIYELA